MGETDHDQPTSLAGGRYLLVERLGEGGMAAVFRAFDQRLQVWRAIKILLPQYAGKQKIARRFEAEAQTMALLEHRHIVRVYDVGRDGANIAYIVMELVEGGCLVDWLEHHGPMPSRMAVRATQEVCYGLAAAHAKGIVHRDVKPHNVMVTREGVCRVTDFGIARVGDAQNSQTKTGSVMGTWGYMAPEQRTNAKGVDERSDVYAVGATLYTLLTDRMPMDLFAAERNASILEGIEEPLVSLLVKCTEYDREDRFPTVTAFAEALEQVYDQLAPIPEGTAPLALDAPPEPARPDPTRYQPATEISADGKPIANPTLMPTGEGATEPGAPPRNAALTMAPDEVPITNPDAAPRQGVPVYDPSRGPDPLHDVNSAETVVRDPNSITGIPIDRAQGPNTVDTSSSRNSALMGAAAAVWGIVGLIVLVLILVVVAFLALRPDPPAQPTGDVAVQPVPPTPQPVEPVPEKPSPENPTPTKPSPSQPTPTQPSPSKPTPMQPSPTQPSPTQPSPTQPTPVQPNAVVPQPAEPVQPVVEPVPEPPPEPVVKACVKLAEPVAWNSSKSGVMFKLKPCEGPLPEGKRVVLHYDTGDGWLSKPLGEVSQKWMWKLPGDRVNGQVRWYVDGEMGNVGSASSPEVFAP